MEMFVFSIMTIIILYLMWDNRRLEIMNRISVKAAVKEQSKRKILESMVYGRELNNESIFDDESLYED